MKLHTSVGPNPHVVKMFIAEKGVSIPRVEVDLRGGENRREPFLARNPAGQTPALELDDGSHLAEITAICEYLEEKFPDPPLIGSTPERRAVVRMWTRRVDLKICEPMANGFRFAEGLPLFQPRTRCLPEAAPGLKAIAQDGIAWLDGQIAGRDYIAGDAFSLADILLYCFLAFGAQVGQPLDPSKTNIAAWFARVGARPSAAPGV